jgi:hypothetical protein
MVNLDKRTPIFLVVSLLQSDPFRWHLLELVRRLHLPDCWIGAGFIRNAVWDHLHRRAPTPPKGDVDVIWYDPNRTDRAEDRKFEKLLRSAEPSVNWSVKNQARMHIRNGDAPYSSALDAMCHWPETATVVAARRRGSDDCEIAAPLGLDDLMNMILRPTAGFCGDKLPIYEERVARKAWANSWPSIRAIRL